MLCTASPSHISQQQRLMGLEEMLSDMYGWPIDPLDGPIPPHTTNGEVAWGFANHALDGSRTHRVQFQLMLDVGDVPCDMAEWWHLATM